MTRYTEHAVDADGWTDWYIPRQPNYRMSCCDCGLVHDVEFRVLGGALVQMRARRNQRATAAKRRHRKNSETQP